MILIYDAQFFLLPLKLINGGFSAGDQHQRLLHEVIIFGIMDVSVFLEKDYLDDTCIFDVGSRWKIKL